MELDKNSLRKTLRNRRKAVTQPEVKSALAVQNLVATSFFRTAKTVLVYLSMNSELDTRTLVSGLLEDSEKTCVVPYCLPEGELGLFRLKHPDELVPGAYGIREPKPELRAERTVSVEEVNLVILPGVGFDAQGNRLGQGGGYYDRLLARLSPLARKVGLGFACQRVEQLPREPHDCRVDTLVTEKGVRRFGPPVWGILGGIACGKSLVSETFAECGIPVFDADKMGHEAYHDPVIREKIRNLWGTLERSEIAARVFREPESLRLLNAVIHPWIQTRWQAFYQQNADALAVVLDAALLLEAGWGVGCDKLFFVDTPRERQWAFARSRGWTDEELFRRERSQWPLAEKKKFADEIFFNDGTAEQLREVIRLRLDTMEVK